jgi:predicted HicB family RNase H-like nuclease
LTTHQAARGKQSLYTKALKIDVPTELHDRWQSAAERKGCSVADWIITTLDHAANEDLSTEMP